ncbi:MAG: GAF domain-containing protein [Myxococcota bacterium]
MPELSSLHRCFQGVIPALLATASRDGTPNVTYLSQVHYVDEQHVALSCQFFNKTRKNIAENPMACVQLNDPVTFQVYQLDLEYRRSESSGALFESMAARIDAIASHTGMTGIFRLIAADVYFVRAVRELHGVLVEAEPASPLAAPPSLRTELAALSTVAQRLRDARDLDGLFAALLGALRDALGFEHAMVLLPDESGERLYTVASLGYGDAGIGAEVALGEGLIGSVAERRKTVRIAHVESELRYGRAIRSAAEKSLPLPSAREIPLPGLADVRSQLAIPLVAQGRLLGVLAVESRRALGFEDWHEAFLDIVGAQVAAALDNAMLRAEAEESRELPRVSERSSSEPPCLRKRRNFCFYKNDDCVFVDDEYLIRNLPGRILWKILKSHQESGRTDFSNRELRLDPTLGLPPIKDNLESRLILLRKRLELKCAGIRLVPKARGQFRLELDCELELNERDSS